MLPELIDERQKLLQWADCALVAIDPVASTRAAVAALDVSRVALLAIGKAAAGMAIGADQALADRIESGLVIGPDGAAPSLPEKFAVRAGDHPVPGDDSLAAGRALVEWLNGLEAELPLLVLLSGGGSSLVEVPVSGMHPDELVRLNRWLLSSGMDIRQVNAIRARFSCIKRGGLLRLAGRRELTGLLISDVPGDRVVDIASGPLSPQPIDWPTAPVPGWLQQLHDRLPHPEPVEGVPEPDVRVTVRNADALDAVRACVEEMGLPVVARDALHGDAARCAERIVRQMQEGPSGVYLFGGETVVALPEAVGRGGRNQHLALAAALRLHGPARALLLALATDGIDGNTGDAGGLVDNSSVLRMQEAGMLPRDCLAGADSGSALEAAGDIIHTGPTGTNVADIVIGWKP